MRTWPRFPGCLDRVNRFAVEHPGPRVVIDLDGLGSMEPVVVGVFVRARLALRSGGASWTWCARTRSYAVFVRSGLDATFTLHRPSPRGRSSAVMTVVEASSALTVRDGAASVTCS